MIALLSVESSTRVIHRMRPRKELGSPEEIGEAFRRRILVGNPVFVFPDPGPDPS